MIPKTLSASSLNVAELCMARWKAENFDRGSNVSNKAADTGTATHGGLEYFVDWVILQNHPEDWTLEYLRQCYELSYLETFRSGDFEADTFKDGWALCQKWFKRTDLSNRRVISVEQKLHFPVKTSVGAIPVTYIRDRFDCLKEPENERGKGGIFEVVDYKTIRWAPKISELKSKIQPRIYALATQIEYPEAEQIWVSFDCLRHEPIGSVMFTREDNARTYRALKKAAERIIATEADQVEERLNSECQYCIRKLFCKTLQSNVAAQGFLALPVEQAAARLAQVDNQLKALKAVSDQLNSMIATHGKQLDITEWSQPDGSVVKLTVKKMRYLDRVIAMNIVGPAIAQRYGKLGMAEIDQLLKGDELTDQQKKQLKDAIGLDYSDPTVKIIPPTPMD